MLSIRYLSGHSQWNLNMSSWCSPHETSGNCSHENARSYVWWPKIAVEIKQTVKRCELCQATCHAPTKTAVHPWEVIRTHLHIDFAGTFQSQIFFIIAGSFSIWLAAVSVALMTSCTVIWILWQLFTACSLPDTVVWQCCAIHSWRTND